MPTGTGKTGVMATVSHFLSGHNVLVVVPWAQLRRQIQTELKIDFWKKVGRYPSPSKEVLQFTPNSLSAALGQTDARIVICTYQTLTMLHSTDAKAYAKLRSRMSLILADEGHREPAPSWSLAVRELGLPTVLFTATPYRNDFYAFKIDESSVYRLPHDKAESDGYIRRVCFHETAVSTNANDFVSELLRFYEGPFKSAAPLTPNLPRVIVRCETDGDIQEITAAIRRAGYTAVGIHDTFSDSEDEGQTRSVPKIDRDALFWVHQNKLIEGVDDSSFCLLAVYGQFRNARALVQQIGRIIRNPGQHRGQVGHVFSRASDRQWAMWNGYLEYERLLGDRSSEPSAGDLVAKVLAANRELKYLDGGFRAPFDPSSPEFFRFLRFQPSALVFRTRSNFAFDALMGALRKAAKEEDVFAVAEMSRRKTTFVMAHYRISRSPCLEEQIAFDFRFGYTIAHLVGEMLFLSSTEGLTPEYLDDATSLIEPAELERVFAGGQSRMAQVSLLNSDLGVYSVRRRTVSANSLSELAPSLADYAHFCSTAEGVVRSPSGEVSRRYVGFTRSRIAQRNGGRLDFEDFVAWTEAVGQIILNGNASSDTLFDRYAEHVRPPLTVVPKHILFDIDDLESSFELVGTDGVVTSDLIWDDRCSEVTNGQFEIEIAGRQFKGVLTYSPQKARFELTSADLQRVIERDSVHRRRNLVARLNLDQSFRVVTDDGLIYAHKRFYKPRLPLWGRSRTGSIDVSRVLVTCAALKSSQSEKGSIGSATGRGWEKGSVFELIDRTGKSGLLALDGFQADVLICDDEGNELADFIALQRKPIRVAFVHAKCAYGSGTKSASVFHDLCSQAVKNLGPLTPQWDADLKNVAVWNRKWKGSKKEGFVENRIRRGDATAATVWDEVRESVRNPAASREVWLVMGAGLSKVSFEAEKARAKPPGYVIQLIYLLQGTWSAVSGIGATMKVFCAP